METHSKLKRYDPPCQLFVLPPDMNIWVPEDDLVYFIMFHHVSSCFIMDVICSLDLGPIYPTWQQENKSMAKRLCRSHADGCQRMQPSKIEYVNMQTLSLAELY
jgi:hypothetical protein